MSYKAGDKVRVNGQPMTITSWPGEEPGPFTATYQIPDNRGGFSEVYGTYWAGASNIEADEQLPTPEIELVKEGDGVVQSTAGELDGLVPESEATPGELPEGSTIAVDSDGVATVQEHEAEHEAPEPTE